MLTGFNEEHNHCMTKSMYFQDTHKICEVEEVKFVKESIQLNVKATQLKTRVQAKFDKPGISTNHIRYIMSKLTSPAQ